MQADGRAVLVQASPWVQRNVRTWMAGLAVMTACSWVRWYVTGSPKVDENYPAAAAGTSIFLGLLVGWGLLLRGWWGLLEEPLPTARVRGVVYAGVLLTAPMLPMLSNDVFSLLTYGSLAASGHDVYTTAAWLPQSPYYGWVGEHWASKVCVYGPATLVSTFPAVVGSWGVWGGIYALHVTWLGFIAVAAEVSFRAFPDRPAFHAMVWCNPLLLLEGAGQLHADVLAAAAVAAGVALTMRGRLRSGHALYALATLGKYTSLFAGPWFWLVGTAASGARARGRRLLSMAATLLALGALLYAPFWRGPATLVEPLRALAAMNPGGSIVEVVGHLVHLLRGGAIPPADLPPQVAIAMERAAKGPTWAVASLVLRAAFALVAARQLHGMLRRRLDPESLALCTGAIVVAAITLFSHRFQSWYLMAALPFFGLRCDPPWRRWWLLAIGFSVPTEFIHVLPRGSALLPVWSVVTNGAVAVVFVLWFRERFLRLPQPTPLEPPPAAAAR